VSPALWIGASYLLGAIPASYLAGRWGGGVDLRTSGSGNLGATNAFRVLGPRIAAPVMLFDLLKGWLPVWSFPRLDGSAEWRWALAYGTAAIIGHVFSVFVRFRGGKGVATATGVFLGLAPLAIGVAFGVWLLVLWRTRWVSLASITGALTLAATLAVAERRTEVLVLGTAVALFVVWAHRANIRRLMRGEEVRLGRGVRDGSPSRGRTT
jgi:glycerol-3-phosphate acyltransferase PlsY